MNANRPISWSGSTYSWVTGDGSDVSSMHQPHFGRDNASGKPVTSLNEATHLPHFGSDNASGMAPEVIEALARSSSGGVDSYGGDALTLALEKRFGEIFEADVAVLPVGTGTVANALSLAFLTPPWGSVFCYEDAHIVVDEANAPEFFTGGAKLMGLEGNHGRLHPDTLRRAAASFHSDDVHHPRPSVLSITQASECGTLYSANEISSLAETAHALGLAVHMDGARFANAVAALECRPADISWRAGVDVLSFGATKNGCMAAEAIIVFGDRRTDVPVLRRHHKRAGQLFSKMRFLAVQLDAYLDSGNWLRWAQNANTQARKLAEGLERLDGVRLLHPVDINEIFLEMPLCLFERLKRTGFGFYPIQPGGNDRGTVRLVTSFNTTGDDVDRLLAAA